ncbi:urease accessory protein [Gordonia sp. PP30]|uniref:urease accessory protein UreF n=1 Tax=Gordonia sp. PP30 TaxID=2935861 RepID=UPI001FFF8D6D|nr:urease accessory UreF family protein [Gordonia sp. PP30]UQE74392.1 urease accessory protein [Gordonia sp. PP30]
MTFAAMLLADARLPTGGHAYSSGVEPALRGGLAAERVRELMLGRAVTTSCVEAGTAVVARHLLVPFDTPPSSAAQGAESSVSGLLAVEKAWAARTPSPALRDASRELARGYRRLARRLWPESPALAALDRWFLSGAEGLDRPCRAVVLGAMAVELGLSPEDLVRLVIYDEAAGAAAALLKLEPRDPAEVSGWIMDACAAAEPRVAGLAALTESAAIPAASAPQSEEWAQAHATSDRRLFRA